LSKIINEVEKLAKPIADKLGLEIWDINYFREGGERYLRIYIDHPDGITLTHCEQFSREIDPLLDNDDIIEGSFILQVSSPGTERVLRRPEHYERYLGYDVEVGLYKPLDGKKKYYGILAAYDTDKITLKADGNETVFPFSAVSKISLHPDYRNK